MVLQAPLRRGFLLKSGSGPPQGDGIRGLDEYLLGRKIVMKFSIPPKNRWDLFKGIKYNLLIIIYLGGEIERFKAIS